MICHHGFVRKKSQPRQSLGKTYNPAAQTSSKRVCVAENDERQGHGLMMVFLEFAIPADIASTPVTASDAVYAVRPRDEQLAATLLVASFDLARRVAETRPPEPSLGLENLK